MASKTMKTLSIGADTYEIVDEQARTDISNLSNTVGGITGDGVIGIANGGTGASDAADARANLGITPANIGAATTSHTHTASDLGAVSKSGDTMTGVLSAPQFTVDKAAGDYTLMLFNSNGKVAGYLMQNPNDNTLSFKTLSADGSSIENYIFPTPNGESGEQHYWILTTKNAVAVEQGGTGATDAVTARTNLGITPANIGAAAASHNHNLRDLSGTAPISKGGTGETTFAGMQKAILGAQGTSEGIDILSLPSGVYSLPNNTTTNMNAPTTGWNPMLVVIGTQNSSTAADGYPTGAYVQMYFEWDGTTWIRRRQWGSWGDWIRFYNSNNIVYSSSQPTYSDGKIWLKPAE